MRYNYINDTWQVAGNNTITMDGTVKELKAFIATTVFQGFSSGVLTFTITSGNVADIGTMSFTDGSNSDIFNYTVTSVNTSTGVYTATAFRTSEDATLVAGASTGTHSKTIDAREGITVRNNSAVTIAVGVNANISTTGNGIKVTAGGTLTLPINEDIPVYCIGASGNVTIIEYK